MWQELFWPKTCKGEGAGWALAVFSWAGRGQSLQVLWAQANCGLQKHAQLCTHIPFSPSFHGSAPSWAHSPHGSGSCLLRAGPPGSGGCFWNRGYQLVFAAVGGVQLSYPPSAPSWGSGTKVRLMRETHKWARFLWHRIPQKEMKTQRSGKQYSYAGLNRGDCAKGTDTRGASKGRWDLW